MAETWLYEYPHQKKKTSLTMRVMGSIIGLIVFILIVNGIAGQEVHGGLVFTLFMLLFLCMVMAMCSHSVRSNFQICPRCHHSAPKGYRICNGCGFAPK